ncbi:MAG: hypothetical protein WCR98_06090 [Saccharofermentanales bacterium]
MGIDEKLLTFVKVERRASLLAYDVIYKNGIKIGQLDYCGGEFLFTSEDGLWVNIEEMKELVEKTMQLNKEFK